jgi:hypothetical protein
MKGGLPPFIFVVVEYARQVRYLTLLFYRGIILLSKHGGQK